MTSKWNDDEFDLMAEIDKVKYKKDEAKKNKTNMKNQFNDFDDQEEDNRNLKLPTISKNTGPSVDKTSKNPSNYNLADVKKKNDVLVSKKTEKDEDEDFYLQESLAPNPSTKIIKAAPKNEKKKIQQSTKKNEQEEIYQEQQFQQEDNYEEDFQIQQESKPSPARFQSKQPPKSNEKEINIPRLSIRKGAESVTKKYQAGMKVNSRNSARSHSQSRSRKVKEDPPTKYTSLAQKTCADYQRSTLDEFNTDRLMRENDKIRGMIKKFNDELNDLINKNIMQLKNKKQEKVVIAEDILKVLEEQKNNNETAYQTTTRQLQRLKGKQGELKQQQFVLSLEQKILQAKASINQFTKMITKLKLQVNNEGNKLTKIDKEVISTQEVNNIKNSLALAKKDEQKNDQNLQKLYIKIQELNKKNSDADNKYNSQIEDAKNKGLSVQINPQLTKKRQDLKKKIEISRLHKSKIQNLYKTKSQMIVHQSQQIKIQIKALQNSIQIYINNCQQMQSQSKKIVEKARRNSKLSEEMVSSLDNIIHQLEHNTAASRQKQDSSPLTHPKGAKKYQSQKNVQKVNIQGVKQVKKSQYQDDTNLKKPTLFKKKQRQEQRQDERVWKDDKNHQFKKIDKIESNPVSELAKFQNKEQVDKKDDEKKKPFVIKKNKDKIQVQPIAAQPIKQELKIQNKKEAEKNQEIPSIAPRMMKFKRNKEEQPKVQESSKAILIVQKPVETLKIQEKQPKIQEKIVQQENQKPIFAPKRFQLRPKDRSSEEIAYTATISQKKPQAKQIQQFKPKGLQIQSEQKNNIIQAKPYSNIQQQKPKFNLRNRDKQRQQNKPLIDLPAQPIKQPQQKITITLNDKSKQNNQFTNPYAQSLANQAPKRQREGPLKKQKITSNAQKQNFNIYEQAEDITNVKQIKISSDSANFKASLTVQQPSLQDLLGIKKNKNNMDEDLIIDANILGKGTKGSRNVGSKKDTNFFGDLQI